MYNNPYSMICPFLTNSDYNLYKLFSFKTDNKDDFFNMAFDVYYSSTYLVDKYSFSFRFSYGREFYLETDKDTKNVFYTVQDNICNLYIVIPKYFECRIGIKYLELPSKNKYELNKMNQCEEDNTISADAFYGIEK